MGRIASNSRKTAFAKVSVTLIHTSYKRHGIFTPGNNDRIMFEPRLLRTCLQRVFVWLMTTQPKSVQERKCVFAPFSVHFIRRGEEVRDIK